MPIQIQALIAVALIVLSSIGTAIVTHKVDAGKLASVELGYKTAEVEAEKKTADLEQRNDDLALEAAVHEASAQFKLETQTVTLVKEITRYVHETSVVGCITFGFVRVLDAAVLGVSASTLPLPAGKSNDDCTGIKADALAESIAANYGTANANAEQLDRLIATVGAFSRQ